MSTDSTRPTRAEIAEQVRIVRAAGGDVDALLAAAPSAPADQNLRDRIAAAIWERQNPGRRWADCEYRWRADAEDDADAVLAVLPAPADEAPPLLSEVWTVWCEDESTWGHFATEDAGKTGTIDYYQEQEERCPDYGWQQDGARLELLAGGEPTGIYLSRHPVYGKPAPDNRASEWRAAAVELDNVSDLFDADNCTCGDCTICTWKEAANHLRRKAGEAQQAGESR
ncbi:hypothetical protein OG785_45330 [Streptomyces sp. NBC_00006]|uniref:hypothetical protein n=1 Tax=Streptomyces sp. NBC_00006 TaxID=2975619 RepID=UPI00225B0336|nr:hypothetical protein [Streptomyces sp. NBC_00006]MCX5528986.1 hypothetical protein [Streptomyces sp. NBC_00006]MCX5537782.1 hypothetical protein [Streptomyces sp. NBC_00006]